MQALPGSFSSDVEHVLDPVAALRLALSSLVQVDPVDLPADQALAQATDLLAARAQLEAVLLRRLGDVDARKLHQLDGSPTTTSWVRAQGAVVDPSTVTLSRRLVPAPRTGRRPSGPGRSARRLPPRIAAALTRLRPLVDRPDGLSTASPVRAT